MPPDAQGDPRTTLRALFGQAVRAVSPETVMPRSLATADQGRTVVFAIGKAAGEMMRVALDRADGAVEGLVVTRRGHLPQGGADWPGIEVIEAGHPYPDKNSVRAAERALEIAHGLCANDTLLVLLSGGGSALLAAPAKGVSLAAKQAVTRALLQSGATIAEINCVRKHLSRIKGGRLALAAGAAEVVTWIISDVPGDDPSLVSSGPTVADATDLARARDIIFQHTIPAPAAVIAALNDPLNETPDAGRLGRVRGKAVIIARARDALAAAKARAEAGGYLVTDLGDELQGGARDLGASHAALAKQLAKDGRKRAIISGGETTVTVVNKAGRGGRNLEYLLGLAIALDGAAGIHAIACDTDGIDGTEDAAGAIISPDTLARASAAALDPSAFLSSNNAYSFFEALGDLVITGPTLTNVNDFRAVLIDGGGEGVPNP